MGPADSRLHQLRNNRRVPAAEDEVTDRMRTGPRVRAPGFPDGASWFNVATPPRLTDLRGRFVLLDFWTFCCGNCLHVIDALRPLEAKYAGVLTVIGVHSP